MPCETVEEWFIAVSLKTFRSVAQPGSAPGLGPGGRRFESSRSDHVLIENAVSA